MSHSFDIHGLIRALETAPLGATSIAPAAKASSSFKAEIGKKYQLASSPEQLRKNHPQITFNLVPGVGGNAIKTLDSWLSSLDKPSLAIINTVTIERGKGVHVSEGNLFIGETILGQGALFNTSKLDHALAHLQDLQITETHLKELITSPEVKNVLSA